MNKNLRLPFLIAILHVPIFFIRVTEPKIKPLPKKKIHITTIHLLEEPPAPTSAIRKESVASKAPLKIPIKKKVVKKPTPKPKPKPKPKAKIKPKISKKKIQKNLNKSLSQKKVLSKGKKTPLKHLGTKKTTKKDAGKAQSEYNTYLQKVAGILSDNLTLPEIGKVKLSLTIRPNGKVVKIVSLLSESSLNLSYLEEHLSQIQLPSYAKQEDRTFTIVFSDEK